MPDLVHGSVVALAQLVENLNLVERDGKGVAVRKVDARSCDGRRAIECNPALIRVDVILEVAQLRSAPFPVKCRALRRVVTA